MAGLSGHGGRCGHSGGHEIAGRRRLSKEGRLLDPQARGLAFRRSFLVGLIYDNPSPNYVVNMQQGVLDAVRGSGLELVVHADLPSNSETLLHRSGRTGRAGKKGVSALIVTPAEYKKKVKTKKEPAYGIAY